MSDKSIWVFVYILLLAVMLIMGVSNDQYKFFALGGLATMGYLLVLSFFD